MEMIMNLLDGEKYERMTAEECWEKHLWGSEARPGSDVYHRWTDGGEQVFCDMLREEYDVDGMPVFGCEIYDNDGDMVGQWFDSSYEGAIRGAAVDSVVVETMREEVCCEDAVNVTARLAYVRLFGECLICEMDWKEFDELLGISMEQVKANINRVDYEWEEY